MDFTFILLTLKENQRRELLTGRWERVNGITHILMKTPLTVLNIKAPSTPRSGVVAGSPQGEGRTIHSWDEEETSLHVNALNFK